MSGATTLQPAAASGAPAPVVSRFEFWPGGLFYTPVVLYWLALGLRHLSFTLPTAANPRIETGGLCGESKTSILALAGEVAREWIAPWIVVVTGADDLARAEAAMAQAGLAYPVVLKPDIGCNGTGVRLVADRAAMDRSLAEFPRDVALVLQELIPHEGEAGLFYVREPGAPAGRLTSLTLKHAPVVVGDGASTLRALIEADPRYSRVTHLYFPRLGPRLDTVPPRGERVRLVFTGNHCKGSVFEDGRGHITAALAARVDAIARDLDGFHFGRIDVRYENLAALRAGEGFRIIEVNGVGSEATHIWDPRTTLGHAYAAQLEHYREAFRIGAAMRRRGAVPTRPLALLAAWRRQRRLMASYPLND